MNSNLLLALQRMGRRKVYAGGNIIAENGSHNHKVAVFMEGAVKVSLGCDDNDTLLYYLTPEQVQTFDFSGFWQSTCTIKLVAQRPTSLLWVNKQDFYALSMKHPSLWNTLLHSSAIVSQLCLQTLLGQVKQPITLRMIDYIRSKSLLLQTDEIPLCREEMAEDLNVSKETISRVVKKLEADKMLKRGLKSVALVSP